MNNNLLLIYNRTVIINTEYYFYSLNLTTHSVDLSTYISLRFINLL